MRVDWRILLLVSFFTVLGGGVLAAVRMFSLPADVDLETLAGRRVLQQVREGLLIDLKSTGVDVLVENCATEHHPDRFLLHVIPADPKGLPAQGFHNFDFNLRDVKGVELDHDGVRYCSHSLSFNRIVVKEVLVGQFSMPAGQCCQIIWSTTIKL